MILSNLLVSQPFALKQPLLGWVAEISLGIYSLTGILVSPEVLSLLVIGGIALLALGSLFVCQADEHTFWQGVQPQIEQWKKENRPPQIP